ncbi:6-bladed beta-propeller [Draconibacterium sediminis]|uniref:6-bladed beta-propeller n=1 Tax=Draconibacterium sediminis TaxID=1544798 RepID=A0A0D8JGH6_9BACT|nr:6-bladed beta-propeller [Draconibacterium sediminis]KJF45691.1 hypothetical protein LH29_10235 [Draconibacterium sediminis]
MNILIKFYTITTLFLLICSYVADAQKVVQIPMGQNIGKSKELAISNIAENIRFIPLETNENCLFGNDISKIVLVDDTIFVSDYNYIFKYDLNGNFITRIGKKGRGPGEYAKGFQTFLVDKDKQQLIGFDLLDQKMMEYDFDANFLREVQVDFFPGPVEWNGNGDIVVYNMSFTYEKEPWHDLYLLDKNAKTIQKNRFKKQTDKRYGLMVYPALFYHYKGKTRYKNPYENVIHELDEKGRTTPVYELDYGKYEKYSDVDDVEVQVKNGIGTNRSNPKSFEKISLLGLSETDAYLFICYGHQERRKLGVFDKSNGTFFNLFDTNFDLYGFHDDLYGGLPLFPRVGLKNSQFFTYYTALEFKELLKAAKSLKPELKNMLNKIDENDNPVLILVELKQSQPDEK